MKTLGIGLIVFSIVIAAACITLVVSGKNPLEGLIELNIQNNNGENQTIYNNF